MSNQINTELLERAAELIDELTSHPSGYDKILEDCIDRNDLDALQHHVAVIEGELAQEYFMNNEVAGVNK